MIIAYADASVDLPIISVGYVIYRSQHGTKEFLDAGTRLINANEHQRNIRWTIQRAEYWSAIIATRAAIDYGDGSLVMHMDNDQVVEDIQTGSWENEAYFEHCFRSFANRFDNWHITLIDRKNNPSHDQARVGLKIGRNLRESVS